MYNVPVLLAYALYSFTLLVCAPKIYKNLTLQAETSAQLFAERTLASAEPHGLLIADSSWFISRYSQAIEGIAPDVTTLYLPSLLFPSYFNPAKLTSSNINWVADTQQSTVEPQFHNLLTLVNIASPVTPITLEPIGEMARLLKEILLFTDVGAIKIVSGKPHKFSPYYLLQFTTSLQFLHKTLSNSTPGAKADIDEHIKVLLAKQFQTLAAIERQDILLAACGNKLWDFISELELPKSSAFLNSQCPK